LWLHSLKVAQLLRSAACLHKNQSRSYLNHLVFINELCHVINHSKYILFTDDVKTFHAIHSVDSCILLQSDIEHKPYWCTAKCTKLYSSKTMVISFKRTTDVLYCT